MLFHARYHIPFIIERVYDRAGGYFLFRPKRIGDARHACGSGRADQCFSFFHGLFLPTKRTNRPKLRGMMILLALGALQERIYRITVRYGHYSAAANHLFIPEGFYPKSKSAFSSLDLLFEQLCLFTTITSLFDITSPIDDGISYKFNGFKSFTGYNLPNEQKCGWNARVNSKGLIFTAIQA